MNEFRNLSGTPCVSSLRRWSAKRWLICQLMFVQEDSRSMVASLFVARLWRSPCMQNIQCTSVTRFITTSRQRTRTTLIYEPLSRIAQVFRSSFLLPHAFRLCLQRSNILPPRYSPQLRRLSTKGQTMGLVEAGMILSRKLGKNTQ